MDSLAPMLFFVLIACALAAVAKLRGKRQEQQDDEGLTPKQQARKKQAEMEEIVRVERLRHQFKERNENPPKSETYGD